MTPSGRLKIDSIALGAAIVLSVSLCRAQSPIGPDLRVNELTDGLHESAQLVPLGAGSWRAVWLETVPPDDIFQPYPEWLTSRSIGRLGELGPVQRLAQGWVPARGGLDQF